MGIPQRLGRRLRPILALGLVLLFVPAACGGGASAPYPQAAGPGGEQAAPSAAPAAPAETREPGHRGPERQPVQRPARQPQDRLHGLPPAGRRGPPAGTRQGTRRGRGHRRLHRRLGGVQHGDRSVATITYRIPADRWQEVIGSLRGLATEVVYEQTQATEVGGQIVDLEARLRNLRASEAALVEIAKGTGKVSDLLEVEAQLTEVRGQIEQLDAQRTQLNDQVAYGTLVTTFGTEIVAVQETAKGWDPAEDVDNAAATLIGVGQAIASAAIWFAIVWLPLLLALLVLALVIRFAYRRFGPKPKPHDPVPGWGERGGDAGA